MSEQKKNSKAQTDGKTSTYKRINATKDVQSGVPSTDLASLFIPESQENKTSASEDYDPDSHMLLMDSVIRAYYNFHQAVKNIGSEGSLECPQSQHREIFSNFANVTENRMEEPLRREHEKLLQALEKMKQETHGEASVEEDAALYWMGRRSLPKVTEGEVEEAVRKLTEFERTQLDDEFNAMQNDGFVMIRDEKVLNFMAEQSKKEVDSEQSPESDMEEEEFGGTQYETETYEGNSMIFGNNVVELQYDTSQWLLSNDNNAPASVANISKNVDESRANPFEATEVSLVDKEASNPPEAEVGSSTRSTSLEVTPSVELAAFIRSRVRTMLIANRVARSREEEVKALLEVEKRQMQDRERALHHLVESQYQSLLGALEMASAIPLIERQLMSKNVDDPYDRQQWQRNEAATCCRGCGRLFTLITTRHHCRRCGIIYCHQCSAHAGILPDKKGQMQASTPSWNRLCTACYNICCEHRRRVDKPTELPKGGYERDGRAPNDPILAVRTCCPNTGNLTLEDGFPPFYVVLPEEWYELSKITISGWVNALKRSPYRVMESLHDGTTSFAGTALKKLCDWSARVRYALQEKDSGW